MFEYRKESSYFAQCSNSFLKHVKGELRDLGATKIMSEDGGVKFCADDKTLYMILLLAKSPQRILAPLVKFDCYSSKYLGILCFKDIHWNQLFSLDQSFGIMASIKDSVLKDSSKVKNVMKESIQNQFKKYCREAYPEFTLYHPDVIFNIHIEQNRATISLDLCGTSMHKKGYKTNLTNSSIAETVAQALVQETEWKGQNQLVDFMCGSGTFLAEALIHYCKIPNKIIDDNKYVKRLPNYDHKLWEECVREVKRGKNRLPEGLIWGMDYDPSATVASLENLRNIPNGNKVKIENKNFKTIKHLEDATIIIEPPFVGKLKSREEIIRMYKELDAFFITRCKNCQIFILTGDRRLLDEITVKNEWIRHMKNGKLESIFAKYVV